jgi:acetyl-CoA C-acetyltransferase
MAKPVIVSATRTAIGTLAGALANQSATKLGGIAVKEAIDRAKIDPAQIDEVILGNVLSAGLGLNPSRVAELEGGVPKEVPVYGVNKACGSGLKAVALAAQSIQLGDSDIVVAGGFESMSGAPYIMKKARFGLRMGHDQLLDSMIADGLTCPITHVHMGVTAENIAAKYGISREEQDEFAAESQQKAGEAIKSGKFKTEIVPVDVPGAKKGETFKFDTDEHPRPDTKKEVLAKLRAAFKPDGGSVTAGNASGINDGAVAMFVATEEAAAKSGLTPVARVVTAAAAGVDPNYMGIGPVPATQKALERAGLKVGDLDVIEANEAFAAQACAVSKELGLDPAKVNPNGSGISLGHPIGATGALITVKALYELQRIGGRYALVTMCIGGGQGIAAIFERI